MWYLRDRKIINDPICFDDSVANVLERIVRFLYKNDKCYENNNQVSMEILIEYRKTLDVKLSEQEKSFIEKYKNINEEIKVVGTIISNPSNKQYKTNYTLQVESINGDKSYKNTKILLSVKKDKNEKYYSYGNKIYFIGEFKEATLQRNYEDFLYSVGMLRFHVTSRLMIFAGFFSFFPFCIIKLR